MIYVNAVSALCSLGCGPDEILGNLALGRAPGLRPTQGFLTRGRTAWLGHFTKPLPPMPAGFPREESRNNRALRAAWESCPAFARLLRSTPRDGIAVVLGTSTSGSDEADRYVSSVLKAGPSGEPGEFAAESQELGDPSRFLSAWLGTEGPAYTVSTACTSSIRAVISGAKLIESGLAQAALVGGADTLARLPVNGFASLGALSPGLCAPFAAGRDGITIGEGAALLWLSREPSPVALLGFGESSDAHHMTAPDPAGSGAFEAMRGALERAGLAAQDLSYVNLHGTGTSLNDAMEAAATFKAVGDAPLCSSTKPLTGHTLGAAGALEAVLAVLLSSRGGMIPGQFAPGQVRDPALEGIRLPLRPQRVEPGPVLTSNFAFGGSNASLLFGAADG